MTTLIWNLAEMLEPHLAEENQQEEANLRHPKPPALTGLLQAKLHRENRRASTWPDDTSSKLAWETWTNRSVDKQPMVLPQPSLEKASIAPWTD
jgi:hypothetical protein